MISIISCSISPAKAAVLRQNLGALLGDEPHEFIIIEDARSLAEGYNRAIRRSRGDSLILCHDDIEIHAPNFRALLKERLKRFDLLGIAGSTRVVAPRWIAAGPPHIFGQIAQPAPAGDGFQILNWGIPARCIGGIQLLDGVFLAGDRAVFQTIPFDQDTFTHFHLYDLDFTVRAAQAGFRLAVCTDFMVIHASRGNFDTRWEEDAVRFMTKHAASLSPLPDKQWMAMQIKVKTKDEALEVIRPFTEPD